MPELEDRIRTLLIILVLIGLWTTLRWAFIITKYICHLLVWVLAGAPRNKNSLPANLLNALEEEARLLNNDEEEKKQEKDGAPQHEPAATATATAETLAPVPAPFVPDGAKPFDLETETLLLLPRALDAGYRGGDGHFPAALLTLPPNLDWNRFLNAYKAELARRRGFPMTKKEQKAAYKVYQAVCKRNGPLRAPTVAFVAAVRRELDLLPLLPEEGH